MKYNALIFTPSTYLMRGPRLANKAGFFYFLLEGDFTPTYRRPVFSTECLGSTLPAQVDMLTAVVSGPLFCPQNVNISHHAPRNLSPVRPGQNCPNKPGNSPAKKGCLQAVFPPVVLPLIH